MTRRAIASVVVACLLATLSTLLLPRLEVARWRESFSPVLPTPSGADAVGLRRTILATGADDRWRPGHERVLMVDIRYPATAREHPLRHYLLGQHMSELARLAWAPSHERRLGLRDQEVNWQFITHSYEWAPPRNGSFPVVVVSAPVRTLRTSLTALAEDLASHGFVVVTVDHPYDAPVVELWPTRKVIQTDDAERELTGRAAENARAADLAAVTDRVGELDAEVAKAIASECVLTISGDLQDQITALTDEPMVEAQILARYPAIAPRTGPIPSLPQAERDFRKNSADFRETVTSLLARNADCAGGGS